MSIVNKKKIRGLQEIQTQSRGNSRNFEPHRAYMRIAVLEMERARRTKERASAMSRVKNIENRFQNIDAETGELLELLGYHHGEENQQGGGRIDGEKTEPKTKDGFKIKY